VLLVRGRSFVRGRSKEADGFAARSKQYAPVEGVAAQALWRTAKAQVVASRGDHLEAERLAREAVDLASIKMPNLRADLVDLAEVLLRAQQSRRPGR
jgi:hypothetical protein